MDRRCMPIVTLSRLFSRISSSSGYCLIKFMMFLIKLCIQN
jgi:hypothetical protein